MRDLKLTINLIRCSYLSSPYCMHCHPVLLWMNIDKSTLKWMHFVQPLPSIDAVCHPFLLKKSGQCMLPCPLQLFNEILVELVCTL